jgi:hypothetical protein
MNFNHPLFESQKDGYALSWLSHTPIFEYSQYQAHSEKVQLLIVSAREVPGHIHGLSTFILSGLFMVPLWKTSCFLSDELIN